MRSETQYSEKLQEGIIVMTLRYILRDYPHLIVIM